MRKYWLYFRLSLIRTFTYRGQLLLFTIASLLSIVPLVAVWLSVGNINVASYSRSELISYYLVGLLLQRLIYSSLINYYVQEVTSDGSIVGHFLTKPVSFFWATFGLSLGWTAVAVVIGGLFTVIFGWLLGSSFLLHLSLYSVISATFAALIGLLLIFVSSLILGVFSLWTVQTSSFVSLYWIALLLFGGITLPLSFFPEFLRNFLNLNPFRFMFSFPLEIILGKINLGETIIGYILGIFWILLFILTYEILWKRGNRVYTGYGQ